MVESFILVMLISLITSIALVARLWNLRAAPGAWGIFLSSLAVSIWSVGYILEIYLPSLQDKLFWARFQYLGIPFVSVWIFIFTFFYSGRGRFFSPARLIATCIIPTFTALLAFTNDYHHWMWTEIQLQSGWSMAPLALSHGWWFWINIANSYLLLVLGSILLLRFALRSQRIFLSQSIIVLIGMVAPWLGNLFYIIGLRPGPNLDLTPIAFSITNLLIAIGFVRYHFMDIRPVAHASIFQAMSDGVIVLDDKGRIVDTNPAAQAIFNHPNAAGQPITSLLPDGIRLPLISEPTGDQVTEINLGEGETAKIYALRTSAIYERKKKITGQLVIFSDVTTQRLAETRLKQAHEQALEANRLKTQLLANVSHDLRTPLGAIMGYADMLRSGVYGPMNQEQTAASIEIIDSANDLLMFVNNLIGQAQLDTGRIILKAKPFLMDELMDACQTAVSLPAQKKGLEMKYLVDAGLPKIIIGDPYWLRQIVLNLVFNAVKFTDRGSVSLRFFRPNPENWAIQVTDTGVGIPEQARMSIFEPFRQVDGSTTREFSGSGLGLSIVKELTTLMHGSICLDSQLGVGSTFTVNLPWITQEKI